MADQEPKIECTQSSALSNALVAGVYGTILGALGYVVLVALPQELKPKRKTKKDKDEE